MDRSHPEYAEAVRFLYDRINYEKTKAPKYDQKNYPLARMEKLLEVLGNPQKAAPIIHVAGTKGKGSVSWFISEILRDEGYKVGLYTSPHLEHIEERFCIQGLPIQPVELIDAVGNLRESLRTWDELRFGAPTFFELTTAIAWSLFQKARTDFNVIEVGLGGRLDSTNVCESLIAIITSISFDHQAQLGNTIPEIAREKAGIIKPGVEVIHGVRDPVASKVIEEIANSKGCKIWRIGKEFDPRATQPYAGDTRTATPKDSSCQLFDYTSPAGQPGIIPYSNLSLRMLGEHQIDNGGIAIAACQKLTELGTSIGEEAIRKGLRETQVSSRIEVVQTSPTVVLDAAHNVASTIALIKTLKERFDARKRTIVFASSKDKDYPAMLQLHLQYADRLILTQFKNNPRFTPVEILEETARNLATGYPSVEILSVADAEQGTDFVLERAQFDELICFTGSFFLSVEVRTYLEGGLRLKTKD